MSVKEKMYLGEMTNMDEQTNLYEHCKLSLWSGDVCDKEKMHLGEMIKAAITDSCVTSSSNKSMLQFLMKYAVVTHPHFVLGK